MATFLQQIIAYVTSRGEIEPNSSALQVGGRPTAKVFPLFFYVHSERRGRILPLLTAIAFAVGASSQLAAADAVAAQDLAKTSGCFKCHGVDKKKDGPALRDAAAKFKTKDDAEDKLIYHVTSGERVKFPDGHEEEHKKVKTSDPNQTKNLVRWILSLEGGTKY
jgi:cytochrome c